MPKRTDWRVSAAHDSRIDRRVIDGTLIDATVRPSRPTRRSMILATLVALSTHCGARGELLGPRCDPPRSLGPLAQSYVMSPTPVLHAHATAVATYRVCADTRCERVEARGESATGRWQVPSRLARGVHFWRVEDVCGTSPTWGFVVHGNGPFALPYGHALDLDRDGRLDLAIANPVQLPASVYLYRGTRGASTFAQPEIALGDGDFVAQLAGADLDGDGASNVLVRGSAGITSLGAASGNARWRFVTPLSTRTIVATPVGDVDGDGAADMVRLDPESVSVLFGPDFERMVDVSPRFDATDGLLGLRPIVASGSLDDDDFADFAFPTNHAHSVSVFRGRADGAPQRVAEIPIDPESEVDSVMLASDVDGDGRHDLLVESTARNFEHRVVSGDLASGNYRVRTIALPFGTTAGTAIPGDIDGDGFDDIVILTNAGTRIAAARGATGIGDVIGARPLGEIPWVPAYYCRLAASGDYNGDGRDDVVVSCGGGMHESAPGNVRVVGLDANGQLVVHAELTSGSTRVDDFGVWLAATDVRAVNAVRW